MEELVLLKARSEYLQGQVTGLQTAVRGLISVHPEPNEAASFVKALLEQAQVDGLGSEWATDAMLIGLEQSPKRILPAP
jgi:hypothetical protein